MQQGQRRQAYGVGRLDASARGATGHALMHHVAVAAMIMGRVVMSLEQNRGGINRRLSSNGNRAVVQRLGRCRNAVTWRVD
jgi:hypothetical protein